ncbi:MAG: hypothetical protein E7642_03525 [Ruminococcaceae bacterium]|nr:hypothetical protein [Oscillospiraceae bacterium]
MKIFCFKLAVLALALTLALFALSCSQKKDEENKTEKLDFSSMSAEELGAYAELGEYKGLEITLGGRTKDEAVWSAVRSSADIKSYPEEQAEYYFAQTKAQYEYYAEGADVSYKEMLTELGTSEEKMMQEARQMAIDDVLFELVKRAENIALSESEKSEHFDRYVKKYVDGYGYSEEYVRKDLSDAVYDSMLYDKVCEFLITNNKFN